MLLGDGTEPFNAVIPFRLRGTFTLKDIQQALARIQKKHPWLRALIAHDDKNIPWFDVPENPISIPVRIIARQGEDQWQEESKREWNTLFDPKNYLLSGLSGSRGKTFLTCYLRSTIVYAMVVLQWLSV
jgi:hypothetical protein